MSNLLTGGLAKIIGNAFSSGPLKFLPATRYRSTLTILDGGDYAAANPLETKCLAIVDVISEESRAALGYTGLNQRLLILGVSINPNGGTMADLTTDDQIEIHSGPHAGIRFDIDNISIDPAGAVITAKGTATN